jgi:7-keto-8-aminopelargonate synthetase-like enzyme
MTKSLSHTRADGVLDQFLRSARLARELGVGRQLIEDDHFAGDTINLRGHDLVNFGLCSYLGLGDDPRISEAAIDAVRRYGSSYSSSIAYTALGMYGELKARLQKMIGAPVVVAASTTRAQLAALPVLVRGGDTVLIDALAHASLLQVLPILGANGADVRQVPHGDVERIADHLESTPGRVWYVFDGLYSMHGDTAPAEQLFELLDACPNLWLYCDDAHGFGWSGEMGRGQFLDRSGWHERLVMAFGLAKSFGTMGGVVATLDPAATELIEVTGGPMLFGGPLPPATLGASIASADIHLSSELPGLQEELLRRIDLVHDVADRIGLPLSATERTPLWFVPVGTPVSTISAMSSMANQGFYVNGAVFPVVPRRGGGVRFTVTRYLSEGQIEDMLVRLNEVRLAHAGPGDVVDLTPLDREDSSTASSP